MDFDPNTGLPWGTSPFKATSQETYAPAFGPSQFDTQLSPNGLGSQFGHPFSSFASHAQQSLPPTLASSIDPLILNPSASLLPWPAAAGGLDFSILDGPGRYGDGNPFDTFMPPASAGYASFGALAQQPGGGDAFDTLFNFATSPAEEADPMKLGSTDFESMLAKMNGVAVQQPATCVTPPPATPTKETKAPPAPRKRKPRSGCAQTALRASPESPTKEAVARRKRKPAPAARASLTGPSEHSNNPQENHQPTPFQPQNHPSSPLRAEINTPAGLGPASFPNANLPLNQRVISSGHQNVIYPRDQVATELGTRITDMSHRDYYQLAGLMNTPTRVSQRNQQVFGPFAHAILGAVPYHTQASHPTTSSHYNMSTPSLYFHASAGPEGNNQSPLASRTVVPYNSAFMAPSFASTQPNAGPQAGPFSDPFGQLLPPLPISPSLNSPNRCPSDVAQRSRAPGAIPHATDAASTLLARQSLSAPSQLPHNESASRTDDIPVLIPDAPTNPNHHPASPSQRDSVSGFSARISPKSSVTSFHTDLPVFTDDNTLLPRYNNPFATASVSPAELTGIPVSPVSSEPHSTPTNPASQTRKSLGVPKTRWKTSVPAAKSDAKPALKSLRIHSLPNTSTTQSNPTRKVLTKNPPTPASSSAIFVNFTSRDSKKLLNGVAPSGSSKRKKSSQDVGSSPDKSSTTKDARSPPDDVLGDPVKKRRLLSSSP
ncbi:hypothetical protein PtA15_14A440 [Puccinia triticina]|uniref:Developmental regulatory protein wetA n=1 Tax=Puccinia triticina TaxID=208348 RepID=A0ABY7D5E2_9BASI|nr:uncharacterized protein PtA15_14A440 [Puccinia triticina]WAQ91556.1 hypothetical protein PtA15_14A440 [Puccinia triticina]